MILVPTHCGILTIQTDGETDGQTDRQRDTYKITHTHTHTHTQRHAHTHTHMHTHTHISTQQRMERIQQAVSISSYHHGISHPANHPVTIPTAGHLLFISLWEQTDMLPSSGDKRSDPMNDVSHNTPKGLCKLASCLGSLWRATAGRRDVLCVKRTHTANTCDATYF